MSLSDYFILEYEKEFGEDENYSCEWFSYCEECHESGWKDCFNYDETMGDYYCDYCLEKLLKKETENECSDNQD